jgi:hypothetical protein
MVGLLWIVELTGLGCGSHCVSDGWVAWRPDDGRQAAIAKALAA